MSSSVLSVKNVSKDFPGCKVLEDVSFSVAPGECLAICGENGAGKSTLLRIIAGLLDATSGSVSEPNGLGLVHQHFSLVPALTVAENVFLGKEPMRFGLYDRARAEADTQKLAERAQLHVDARARVETLNVGERQRVELIKALRTADKLLLLDEPTAVLGPREIDGFLTLVESLKASGLAVIFVSHKLHEVARIADRVVVLRHGKLVLEASPKTTPLQAIADAMVGEHERKGFEHAEGRSDGALVARLDHASAGVGRNRIEDVSLELNAGSITGIAGVEGNGQHGLFSVLVGLLAPDQGRFTMAGAPIKDCAGARAAGIRAVPADRHELAMLPGHDSLDHLRLGSSDTLDASALLERFDVRPKDPHFDALRLSGGNQQKLVFARELGAAGAPRLLVVHEPTRGVDFLAKEHLWTEIDRARKAGAAVVVISSDLDELQALSDKLLVLYRGKISAEKNVADAMAGLT